jgi:uncharacterized protein (TIGR02680 family)
MRQDFHLLDSGRRAIGKDRLRDALEGQGQVMDTASAYRRAVDERLFQLGQERYEALINLLIQLRQPQLAKRPNERALSDALTQALPPLDQAILNDLAESFRNLEADQAELDALEQAQKAVTAFLEHYRRYARVAARRRARKLRQAESRYESTRSELNNTRSEKDKAQQEQTRWSEEQTRLQDALEDAHTEDRSLRDSPAMRDARRLQELQSLAEEKQRTLAWAEQERQRLQTRIQRERSDLARCESDLQQSLGKLEQLREEWALHAQSAGIAATHRLLLEKLPPLDADIVDSGAAQEQFGPAKSFLERLNEKRRAALDLLRRLNRILEQAQNQETLARERRQKANDDLEHLLEQRLQARDELEQATQALLSALRLFLEQCQELRLSDGEPLLQELRDWATSLEGDNPVRLALEQSYRDASRQLEQERAALLPELRELDQRLSELKQERQRLEAGEDRQPPLAYTLDAAARQQRPGAPLWRLSDFHADLDSRQRAGLEAALEASGLLDAWVSPDGELLSAEGGDRILLPDAAAPIHLGQALVPAIDPGDALASQVDAALVQRILAAIGWGASEHPAWVDAAGRWRLGAARGVWSKTQAEYLGSGAREAARRRRLQELAQALSELEAQRTRLSQHIDTLKKRRATLDSEHQSIPNDEPLRQAHLEAAALERRLAAQKTELQRLENALQAALEHSEQRRRERDESALDLSLPTDALGLQAVEQALADYRASAGAYWPSLSAHWNKRIAQQQTAQSLLENAELFEQQKLELQRLEAQSRAAAVEHASLRDSVGDEIEQLQGKLAILERRQNSLKQQQADAGQQHSQALAQAARQEQKLDHLNEQLEARDGERREAVEELRRFAAEGLLNTATPEIAALQRPAPWPLGLSVRLARDLEQSLSNVADGDDTWSRLQKNLLDHYQNLQSALARHGHEASAEQAGELLLVRVLFRGKPLSPVALAEGLEQEVAERSALLSNKEKELLEDHLINDVAEHLQSMISDTERRVQAMNRELERRPTSTGMKLRLAWRVLDEAEGAPSGLKDARERLLRQVVDAWSPDDRIAVGAFLKQRIDQIRNDDDGGSLLSHLDKALDYRHWHRFSVERLQQGRWRPAYGPASGGERALVVTLPLFAAASGHYSSAAAEAPRLITLDEAFAGVDDDARAKCMGLLTQFDLDYMMTSEREWGCYPEVNGLAIAHLVRHEGIDAVYVSRWLWDGKRRSKQASPLLETSEPAGQDSPVQASLL